MFHSGPIRPGTRGGQGDFTWAEVSADKDREVREIILVAEVRWW